jgi:hypothetical protein
MATYQVPSGDVTNLRSRINTAAATDVLQLMGTTPFNSAVTLGQIQIPSPSPSRVSGYTVQGTNSDLTQSAVLINTRIYDENTDSSWAPGKVEKLTLEFQGGNPATDGKPLLNYKPTKAKPSRSITIDNVLFKGSHSGWVGNGGLYMSLREFYSGSDTTKMTNVSLAFTSSTINITGQGNGFDGTASSGGSAFLHSWNNLGAVQLFGNQFDEAGYLSSFNFLNFSGTPTATGAYTISGNTFFRSDKAFVRPEGNRLENVTATLSGNTFSNGSYLDLYGQVGSISIIGNTFNMIAGGYGIRMTDPLLTISGTPPTISTVFSGTNTFTGDGLPLKYVSSTAGTITAQGGTFRINGLDYSSMTAGSQVDDAVSLLGVGVNRWANGDDGNDSIASGASLDYLKGGNGNDTLNAGNNADMLFGDAGNDYLVGGQGDDTVTGGGGNDRFRWSPGNNNDRITDFVVADDQFVLSKASPAGMFATTTVNNDLAATDFLTGTTIAAATAANAGKLTLLSTALTNAQVTQAYSNLTSSAAYFLVYNSDAACGQLVFDNNWGDSLNRSVISMSSVDQTTLNSFTRNQFFVVAASTV